MNEYENIRRVGYTFEDEGIACFVPVCPKCGAFVKADRAIEMTYRSIHIQDEVPNATCKKCGRVAMPFDGFM